MIGWLRLIVFTILVPGTVAGYIPQRLIKNIDADWQNQALKWTGLVILATGIIIYLLCAINFLLKGLGTPNIWFARRLKFIMGEEPKKMVSSGLYKYSRNPMYLGVLTTVLGEALFYERTILLHYLVFLFILFHLVIIMIEEPHLEKKFGKDYKQYKKQTRRWL